MNIQSEFWHQVWYFLLILCHQLFMKKQTKLDKSSSYLNPISILSTLSSQPISLSFYLWIAPNEAKIPSMFCDKHMARTNVTFYFLMPCPGLGSSKASEAWRKKSRQRFLWAAMLLTWPFPPFFQAGRNGLAQDSSKWAHFRAIQRMVGGRHQPCATREVH